MWQDLNLEFLSRLQRVLRGLREADTGGCTGDNDGSGRQCRRLRQERDELGNGEDEIICTAVLEHFVVAADSADAEFGGVGDERW